MKKQINQLRTGVYLSYVNLLLGSLIPMIYTPVMLNLLGEAEHGLYALASSVISYLSLLNFGFGSTIIRYISKFRSENDRASIQRTYGFFLILYSVLAGVVLLGGCIIALNSERIFGGGLLSHEQQRMRVLLLIMTAGTAISFPASVIISVISAHERYLFQRIIDILSTVITPAVNLSVLWLGYASIGIAVAGIAVQIVMFLLNLLYCSYRLNLKPTFERIPSAIVREMLGFSLYVFLGTLIDMLFWATDKVILGMLVSSVAVSIYQIGGTFNSIVMQLSTSISGVLTPRITGMVVKEASDSELTELFVRVGRIQFLIVALIVSGFAVFGQVFIDLWIGTAYADAYWIAILTLFPLCIPLIQNTGISIIMAKNKHAFRSVIYLAIAVVNVITTYLVVPYWGGIGAAACSCVSYLVGQGLIMNIYYHKIIGIDIPLFWRNILRMMPLPAVMMLAGFQLQKYIQIKNWLSFFCAVAIYAGIYCLGMYSINMNDYEKNIIRAPLSRILFSLRKS